MNFQQPEVFTCHGPKIGPTLLLLGGIHGDEICGPQAIRRLMRKIANGEQVLEAGKLVCVPIANPEAHRKNVRFTEENLNRIFRKWENPDSYEKMLANALTELVDQCDILLDIHSMTAKSDPAVFIDFPTKTNIALAEVLGISYAIVGWPELYGKEKEIISDDTTTYAHAKEKSGVLIECGQHLDPEAEDIAYTAIQNALVHLSMTEGETKNLPLRRIRMRKMYIKNHNADRLARDWAHLDSFKKGDVLATAENGPIMAEFDGVMLLPKKDHPVGTEWFYLGSYE